MAAYYYEDAAVPSAQRIFVTLVAGLLAFQLVYLASFNLLPSMLRTAIAGGLLLTYVGMFAYTLRIANVWTIVYVVGFGCFVGSEFLNFARSPDTGRLINFVRDTAGLIALIIVTVRPPAAPSRPVLLGLWLTLIVAGLAAAGIALLGDPYLHHGMKRLALIAGGPTGLHPSAYAATCFLLLSLVFLRYGVGSRLVTAGLAIVLLATVVGYQVRTTWVMLAILGGWLTLGWLSRRSPVMAVGLLGAGLAVAAIAAMSLNIDLAEFSSGRTVIYQERLQVLESRDAAELLVGTGSGTDRMPGMSVWRSDDKDSHNDFLAAVFGEGFIGLLGLMLMLGAAFFAMPPIYRGWLLMIAASSMLSNGILMRPSVGPPLVMILYLALALRDWPRAREEEAMLTGQPATAWR